MRPSLPAAKVHMRDAVDGLADTRDVNGKDLALAVRNGLGSHPRSGNIRSGGRVAQHGLVFAMVPQRVFNKG